ncbi:urocortin-3 [Eublepharis macularius]|uniref:Urocortin-3 n=1 Tax=Eublepharis macularius TaxID=481883 RepID=A0AA97JSN5_EUBMA|nr:urocortin-3 [Eublepharis macularius]
MAHPKLLLLLLVLFAARTGLNLKLYKAESIFSCINAALSEAKKGFPEENSLLEKRSFKFSPDKDASSEDDEEEAKEEEDKEKRTFPAITRYKYLAQTQGKGKVYQGQAKSDRRTKFTLSLDVPTNIMNILFDIAKAKNLRAKAAANAHLMAQIGRRK